MICC